MISFSQTKKKRKKRKSQAVLILSRPVHKSQVINPHDIPGCWILHLELWKTDSWKIYKIPGSQSAPYWLHIWEVPASCLEPRKVDVWDILCSRSSTPPPWLFSDVTKAKKCDHVRWMGPAQGLFCGDSHKTVVAQKLLPPSAKLQHVVGMWFTWCGRSGHRQQNCFSCFEYTLNFVSCNITELEWIRSVRTEDRH